MGNGQISLQNYVKCIKRNEQYAAELRYAQYKKALFKDGKISTKIKFYLKRKESRCFLELCFFISTIQFLFKFLNLDIFRNYLKFLQE